MLLRKRDIDPLIIKHLPLSSLTVSVPRTIYWVTAVVAALTVVPVLLLSLRVLNAAGAAAAVLALVMAFITHIGVLVSVILKASQKATVAPNVLRELGKVGKFLDPVEREYCRTAATLAESSALAEPAARELLDDLNRLLAAHRTLMEQELPKKARIAREEAVQKTFQELRASLKRAGKVVAEPPLLPAVVAKESVDETISRVRLQARSLEQATEEVQALRR